MAAARSTRSGTEFGLQVSLGAVGLHAALKLHLNDQIHTRLFPKVVYNVAASGGKWVKVGEVRLISLLGTLRVGKLELMFLGEFSHTIDDKGRLTLPSKFRALLAGGCVVTRGIDQCLFVFPLDEWQNLAQKVSSLPLGDAQAREFRRLLFSGASDDVPDKQGRVLIPQYLREYAGLNGEVVVAGLYTHIEIWSPSAWSEARKGFESGALDAGHWAELGV